jgi:CheY-like chemotaxis protein
VLRELGYQVLEAPDGNAALSLLERSNLSVDLLFTAVPMPIMWARTLRARPGRFAEP